MANDTRFISTIMVYYLKNIARFFFLMLIMYACKKENVPAPEDTALLFSGDWVGNTSQMKLLEIDVREVNSAAWIVGCRLGFIENGNYRQIKIEGNTGIARIDSNVFEINLPDQWRIEGTFHDETTCNGFLIAKTDFTKDTQKHSFLLKSQHPSADLHDIAQVDFSANGISYNFRQQINRFFPASDIQQTDSGYIVSSSFKVNGNNISGNSIITIRHNSVSNPDDIPQVFKPGKKQFADDTTSGFEIIFNDPGFYFETWSTTAVSGNQSDSNLEIVDFEEIDTGNQSKLFKYVATFNCTVYRKWSRVIEIENGFMIGFIAVE